MFAAQASDSPDVHVWTRSADTAIDFTPYFKHLTREDAVIDVGCGQGHFLRALKQAGISATGVDLNAAMVAELQHQGLPVLQGDALEVLRDRRLPFTVLSMLDFAEHIPLATLLALLDEAGKTPGVKILLQTPNLDSLIGMKFYFHLPSHVTPLHPVFLRAILRQHHFEILEEWTDYGGLPWRGFRRWLSLKILNGLFGPPMASMFLGGGNICLVARSRPPEVAPC